MILTFDEIEREDFCDRGASSFDSRLQPCIRGKGKDRSTYTPRNERVLLRKEKKMLGEELECSRPAACIGLCLPSKYHGPREYQVDHPYF